jgi:UDP-N-acetylglucosamine--N-acetylmuramyl-(pentapeptide) pyrophosphoryl-undecaprenol N-acetylglucosamine transferase
MPVRAEIENLRPAPPAGGEFNVLVTGGSQGASILSQVVPDGLALLPVHFRRRMQVTHQARLEDIEEVRQKYLNHGIPAEIATYLPDLPEHLAWAHIVIARAGASTISELTAAGRPAILVPLPSATDDHQRKNARVLVDAGGALMVQEHELGGPALADAVGSLLASPERLAGMAAAMRRMARPGAAEAIVDRVLALAGRTAA